MVVANSPVPHNSNKKGGYSQIAKKSGSTNIIPIQHRISAASLPPTPANVRPVKRQAAIKAAKKCFDADIYTFNPDTSTREKRKLEKRLNIKKNELSKRVVHDEYGFDILSGTNLCDCLNKECPGCFFKCPTCWGPKCGHECRVNRKFKYDSCEYHGYTHIVKNPLTTDLLY